MLRSQAQSPRRPLNIEVLELRQLLAASLFGTPLPVLPEKFHLVESLPSAELRDNPLRGGEKSVVVVGGQVSKPWGPVGGWLSLDNLPPLATNDKSSTSPGQGVSIDVLANDWDPDGNYLKVFYATDPQHGKLYREGASSGKFIYLPDTGFAGIDQFTYTVYDRYGDSDNATVNISVGLTASSIPRFHTAPVAGTDEATLHAGNSTKIDVLANDIHPDREGFHLDRIVNQPLHGQAVLSGGKVTYIPKSTYVGDDRFTYQILDVDGDTAQAEVVVHVVNRPPTARNDSGTTFTNQPLLLNIRTNDTDPDGDTLSVVSFTQPGNGSVRRVGQNLEFTPNQGSSGPTSFRYIIGDLFGGRSEATVRIDVVNRAPAAANDEAWVHANTAIGVNVLRNDRDPDGDALSISTFEATTPSGGSIRRQGSNLVYTPAPGFLGDDSFRYTISDPSWRFSSASVRIHVGNRSPVANADWTQTPKNTALTIHVLKNDSDPDGDALALMQVSSQTTQGGTAIIDSHNPRRVIYTPKPGFRGRDLFTYTIRDDQGALSTATVTVMVGEN